MVSNILSWVELFSSGVVSELQGGKQGIGNNLKAFKQDKMYKTIEIAWVNNMR